jgi:hypothetical protein
MRGKLELASQSDPPMRNQHRCRKSAKETLRADALMLFRKAMT